MFISILTKLQHYIKPSIVSPQKRKCIFGLKELLKPEKLDKFVVSPVTSKLHETALNMIKEYYLPEHVLVRDRNMDIFNDYAFDEYIIGLLKQGNSLYAKSGDGSFAGLIVNFASSPVDPKNLRNYAFYRQDPNTKDFLYFVAKMQELPNLWNIFKQTKVFEIKMITVVPEYRRQGLAVLLTEKSKDLARDQGYNIIRFDCINPHDYKIAERCMLNCIVKFPLHRVRGLNAPFVKRSSDHNVLVRVYTNVEAHVDSIHDDDFKKLELYID